MLHGLNKRSKHGKKAPNTSCNRAEIASGSNHAIHFIFLLKDFSLFHILPAFKLPNQDSCMKSQWIEDGGNFCINEEAALPRLYNQGGHKSNA